jgi:hypothetical protein
MVNEFVFTSDPLAAYSQSSLSGKSTKQRQPQWWCCRVHVWTRDGTSFCQAGPHSFWMMWIVRSARNIME